MSHASVTVMIAVDNDGRSFYPTNKALKDLPFDYDNIMVALEAGAKLVQEDTQLPKVVVKRLVFPLGEDKEGKFVTLPVTSQEQVNAARALHSRVCCEKELCLIVVYGFE